MAAERRPFSCKVNVKQTANEHRPPKRRSRPHRHRSTDGKKSDSNRGILSGDTGVGNVMGLILLVVIIFLLLGGVGFGVQGTLGTVLIVLAVLWLIGGIGFHGSRSGWYGGGRRL